jgi:hypothetical protein
VFVNKASNEFSRNNIRIEFLLELVENSTLESVGYIFEYIHPWSKILQ